MPAASPATRSSPISDVRGSADYRLQLAENIMVKFWYDVMPAAPPIRAARPSEFLQNPES